MRKLKNAELNRLDLDSFKQASKSPLILVLDNVRSTHNVGSIFRTADAFRVQEIILCGITATPLNAPNPLRLGVNLAYAVFALGAHKNQ